MAIHTKHNPTSQSPNDAERRQSPSDSTKPTTPLKTSDPAEWVELHGDAMYRFAVLRVSRRDMAEEAVQEAFLAALAARATFDGRSSERTWLIGILRYKLIDLLRKHRKDAQRTETASDNAESLFDHGIWIRRPQNWNAAELNLEAEEFQQVLADCIDNLPSPMREAFCLRVLDDIPTDEVCKCLDIRTTNLWTLVHRAKLRLRRCLTERWFGGKDA